MRESGLKWRKGAAGKFNYYKETFAFIVLGITVGESVGGVSKYTLVFKLNVKCFRAKFK